MTTLSMGWFFALLGLAACASTAAPTRHAPAADPCRGARPVDITDLQQTSGVFAKLAGKHYAELVFTCPTDTPCALPADRQLELTIEPARAVACEFAACRVPYLDSLPFIAGPSETCPKVLWSTVSVQMKSDAGTFDEREAEVDLLVGAHGEAFLRFLVDNPRSFSGAPASPSTRAVLLDVQLERAPAGMRGQVAALAAPLSSGPTTELRFAALWTATWETVGE